MKDLMTLIRARHSVRKFADGDVSVDDIKKIVEAARWAPSACNAQPWRFVAVTDPLLRAGLAADCLGRVVNNRWASGAGAFLVVCASKSIITHHLAEPIAGVSYHQIDIGIAMEHAVLKAVEMGLGTCYIGWFDERKVKKLLKLPRKWKVVCILALGHTEKREAPPPKRLPLEDILFLNGPNPAGGSGS